jgi:nitroreductase
VLADHLKNRFTAKWWDPKSVEDSKLEAILECAYQAPSKQGHYDFEIVVLTDSPEGKEFKEWLYWENTACLNMVRGAPGTGFRRYNGQVLAPVVIVWLAKKFPPAKNPYGESDWLRTNNDCIISSTMAMCQAEEIGISTGFCGTLGGTEIADRLGKPDKIAVISVGFGYATPDKLARRPVFKNGATVGFDLSNTSPSIRTLENRKNRPTKISMINYV